MSRNNIYIGAGGAVFPVITNTMGVKKYYARRGGVSRSSRHFGVLFFNITIFIGVLHVERLYIPLGVVR